MLICYSILLQLTVYNFLEFLKNATLIEYLSYNLIYFSLAYILYLNLDPIKKETLNH